MQELDSKVWGSRKGTLETKSYGQFAGSPYFFRSGSEVNSENSLDADIRHPFDEFTDDSPHLADSHRVMANRCLAVEHGVWGFSGTRVPSSQLF